MRDVRQLGDADPNRRRSATYALVSRVTSRLDVRIYNPSYTWWIDDEMLSLWSEFPGSDGTVISDRHFNLYQLARAAALVPGDTAECGVLSGAGSYLILRATSRPGRRHHIFDSFEGLSSPDASDGAYWNANELRVAEQVVTDNLHAFPDVALHRGWIPDRFPAVSDRTFAFVHVDVDLYQPTLDSIRFFYDRLSPGGIIVCDDYGSRLCPGARAAMDEAMADKPEPVVRLSTGQAHVTKACG